jgi:hypothetical protein
MLRYMYIACLLIHSIRIAEYLRIDLAFVLDVAMLMRTLLWHACETGSLYLTLQAFCCSVKILFYINGLSCGGSFVPREVSYFNSDICLLLVLNYSLQ